MKKTYKLLFLILLLLFVISLSSCEKKKDIIDDDRKTDIIDDNGKLTDDGDDNNTNDDPSEGNNGGTTVDDKQDDGIYEVSIFDSESEVDWDKVKNANIETYKWVDSDKFNSFGKLVYVKDYGFICILYCEEENPYVEYHNDGDPVYKDSAMEFFVSLGSELGYINLETNSVGARLQQYSLSLTQRESVFNVISDGISVQAGRENKFWTLTIRLTLEDIKAMYPNFDASVFKTGYEFSGNFYKIGTNPTTGLRHYGMWKEVGGTSPNFHQPNDFGKFILK